MRQPFLQNNHFWRKRKKREEYLELSRRGASVWLGEALLDEYNITAEEKRSCPRKPFDATEREQPGLLISSLQAS